VRVEFENLEKGAAENSDMEGKKIKLRNGENFCELDAKRDEDRW